MMFGSVLLVLHFTSPSSIQESEVVKIPVHRVCQVNLWQLLSHNHHKLSDLSDYLGSSLFHVELPVTARSEFREVL